MNNRTLCIGSALWDVIGHADRPMEEGFDRPGVISRHPGGVALNVAYALQGAGVRPTLLSAIGKDADGDALVARMTEDGIDCDYLTRVEGRTDIYMAIEHDGHLFGAVADCASLENAGASIFEPVRDGRVSGAAPFSGVAVIDGNLPIPVLAEVVETGLLQDADVLFVPASPGKARRMSTILRAAQATICVNRIEAEIICDASFRGSEEAARALADLGCSAIVTDGGNVATLVCGESMAQTAPPVVDVVRVTGAGDSFLAGFVAARISGANDATCLDAAADMAARHISDPAP